MLITISLPRLPAASTSLLLMIQPIGSLALAAVIFSESPSGLQLVGVVMVIGAVVFATRKSLQTEAVRVAPAPGVTVAATWPPQAGPQVVSTGTGPDPEPGRAGPRPARPRR